MHPLTRWLLLAAFVAAILAGKLALIDHVHCDLPRADQWDAEGATLVQPWFEHRLTIRMLAHPHNEHRVITTKLFVLGLLLANGRWDGLVEMTAAAFVHTAFAIALLLLARRWLSGGWLVGFGILLVILFALPFAWENTLYGFQVQFYFLLLFSVGHIVWSLEPERFGWRWALGQLCGIAALGSMASGSLSAAAVLTGVLLRSRADGRWRATAVASGAVAAVLLGLGWWMRTPVPWHTGLAATSPAEFAHYVLAALSWPLPVWLPLTPLPALWLVFRAVRSQRVLPAEVLLFALLVWSTLNALALSYGRGHTGAPPPRYLDLLAINVALGFIGGAIAARTRTAKLMAGGWIAVVIAGVLLASWQAWAGQIRHLPDRARRQETVVREYLRTGNAEQLSQLNWPDIPYPSAPLLVRRLESPAIRSVLPPSVQPSARVPHNGVLRPAADALIRLHGWLALIALGALAGALVIVLSVRHRASAAA